MKKEKEKITEAPTPPRYNNVETPMFQLRYRWTVVQLLVIWYCIFGRKLINFCLFNSVCWRL